MHDTCLPSFHHGTCPRRLNCQVFTNGRFIFLYFFYFLTLDFAGLVNFSDFVGFFWIFMDFVYVLDVFGFFTSWYNRMWDGRGLCNRLD